MSGVVRWDERAELIRGEIRHDNTLPDPCRGCEAEVVLAALVADLAAAEERAEENDRRYREAHNRAQEAWHSLAAERERADTAERAIEQARDRVHDALDICVGWGRSRLLPVAGRLSAITNLLHKADAALAGDVAPNLVPLCSLHHGQVTSHEKDARQRLAEHLTDEEYAHVIAELGEGGMERLFGIEYRKDSA